MLCTARDALILEKLTFRVPRSYTEWKWNITIINMLSTERYLDKNITKYYESSGKVHRLKIRVSFKKEMTFQLVLDDTTWSQKFGNIIFARGIYKAEEDTKLERKKFDNQWHTRTYVVKYAPPPHTHRRHREDYELIGLGGSWVWVRLMKLLAKSM